MYNAAHRKWGNSLVNACHPMITQRKDKKRKIITVTIGGSFQRVVREHSINRPLDFAQVEVFNITYLSSCSNLTTSPTRMSSSSSCLPPQKQNTNLNYLNRRRKSLISKTMELGRTSQTNPLLSWALNFSRQKKTNRYFWQWDLYHY